MRSVFCHSLYTSKMVYEVVAVVAKETPEGPKVETIFLLALSKPSIICGFALKFVAGSSLISSSAR